MNRKNTPRMVLTFLLALTMAVPFLTMTHKVAAEGFTGAIQTSKGDGTTVNQNLYDSKEDVYLNGGPQNENSAGLPPGDYYFQVTNPSGSLLLSTDNASCRQVTVDSQGRIAGAAAAAGLCAHPNGTANAANGSLPVQLAPFNDTDNNGGEYKVWLIRKTVNTSISQADPRVIIFDNRDAKTDNFKVKIEDPCTDCEEPEETLLSGTKFYDANVNGLNDAEAPVADVRVDVHWFKLDGDGNETESGDIHTATDATGIWTAEVPTGAFYKVCEQLPFTCPGDAVGSYWAQTAPAADSNGERCYSGVAGDQAVENLDFGNVCFVPPCGGRTLGFWSNKNGEVVLKANDNFAGALAFLAGLNLKKAVGGDFDPASYNSNPKTTAFRPWLLDGNAVNMAYMLSVQLSATALSIRYVDVTSPGCSLSNGTIVDGRGLGIGFVTVGELIFRANTELNMVNPDGDKTFTGNPLRADEEIIKNALDSINNNRLYFAAPTACGVCYPPPV